MPPNLGLLEILHVDFFETRFSGLIPELLAGKVVDMACCHKLAFDHDAHLVANALYLIEQVGREKDGNALVPAQRMDQIEHAVRAVRVEAHRRLIEKDHLRRFDQDLRDAEPLPHPFGISPNLLFGFIEETHRVEQRIDFRCGHFVGQAVEPGHEPQVLPRVHFVVKAYVLGQVADLLLHPDRVSGRVEPTDDGMARSRPGETEEHEQGRCLARAVRPEEPEYLTLRDAQRQAVYRDLRAVYLFQAYGLYNGPSLHYRLPSKTKRAQSPAITKRMMPIPIQPHAEDERTVTRISRVLSAFSPFIAMPTE